ncbi:hypothetical protein PAPYR_9650 [Paratrimastix pyriformis]|uniref:Uncharacterized protein n=1 Tax=Paratrimastix pyriformis TaxID=342808 RepID=A0ABQ8U7X1_9EUKA|nr:hypothetical protein PAPYR_9650 [Paratrimastix pyriformis]
MEPARTTAQPNSEESGNLLVADFRDFLKCILEKHWLSEDSFEYLLFYVNLGSDLFEKDRSGFNLRFSISLFFERVNFPAAFDRRFINFLGMGITYHFSPYSFTRSPSHSRFIYSFSHPGDFQASTHSVHFRHSSILISPPPLGTGVSLTTPNHLAISQLHISPPSIWIGASFSECTFLISPPTRAQGPPTLVAHHPVLTVQVPVATLPASATAVATFPAAMLPPGSPADTPRGSPTAGVGSPFSGSRAPSRSSGARTPPSKQEGSRTPPSKQEGFSVGPVNGPHIPLPTLPTTGVQSKPKLLELVVGRLLADRLSSPHANPWIAPEWQPNVRCAHARSRAIPRLNRQGRPILDGQGEPVSWTPDFLCHVLFHKTRPVNLFDQFVDTAPRDVPRPIPQSLSRISPTAPKAASTPTSQQDEDIAYIMGEVTSDSTAIRTKLHKLKLYLSDLVRYKTLATNSTPRPASSRGRASPASRPASTPPDDEIARILTETYDDDEGQFHYNPLICVAFVAINDPPTPADQLTFLVAAKDMGLGELLAMGRLRLVYVEKPQVRPPQAAYFRLRDATPDPTAP